MAILLKHNFQAHVLRHMGGVVVQHFAINIIQEW
jgi:hypothetical protein